MTRATHEKNCPERPETESVLGRCLVDGDPEARSRARRARRKTFGISLALEFLLLGLLLAVPLFTSVAHPSLSKPLDFLPFVSGRAHLKPSPTQAKAPTHQPSNYRDYPINYVIATRPLPPVRSDYGAADDSIPIQDEFRDDLSLALPSSFIGVRSAPPVAPPGNNKKDPDKRPLKLSGPVVEAQLISRIEPRYPPLGQQMRQEGTVVLHAIIGRDGHINSLEVVSGSPFFVQAALEAVRQWRYRPTMLNGEPVEVETSITVIFRLHE